MNRLRAALRRITIRVVGNSIASSLVGWSQTLDAKILRHDPTLDPVSDQFTGPAIYVFWHEYMLVPCCMRRDTGLVLLASRHRDADWLIGLASGFGYDAVRGSTANGGAQAVLKIVKQLRGKSLVITPDGPLGPRRIASSGCIYLASLLGIPIVPLGCGYDSPWRFEKAWDCFAVPKPGSRVRSIMAEAIRVPKKISREEVESFRLAVESSLESATVQAEKWAQGGESIEGESPFFAAPAGTLTL